VVECDLAKVEVAGSNPVSRSRFPAESLPGSDLILSTLIDHNLPPNTLFGLPPILANL
jgi:hypothetical protein